MLNRIDQAIVAGFAGRDIELNRIDAALNVANGRLVATQEQIARVEPFKDTAQREGSGLRVRWRRIGGGPGTVAGCHYRFASG